MCKKEGSIKTIVLFFAIGCGVITGGCSLKYGNARLAEPGNIQVLKKGEATKFDVYDQFGQPHDVSYERSSQLCTWEYYWTNMSMSLRTLIPYAGYVIGGYNTDTVISKFIFDQNHVMVDLNYTKDQRHINTWSTIGWLVKKSEQASRVDRVNHEMEIYDLPHNKEATKDATRLDAIINHVAQDKH
jgi:hypothetical protein